MMMLDDTWLGRGPCSGDPYSSTAPSQQLNVVLSFPFRRHSPKPKLQTLAARASFDRRRSVVVVIRYPKQSRHRNAHSLRAARKFSSFCYKHTLCVKLRRGRRTFQHISPSLHLKLVLLPLPFTHCWPQFEEPLFFFFAEVPPFSWFHSALPLHLGNRFDFLFFTAY